MKWTNDEADGAPREPVTLQTSIWIDGSRSRVNRKAWVGAYYFVPVHHGLQVVQGREGVVSALLQSFGKGKQPRGRQPFPHCILPVFQ